MPSTAIVLLHSSARSRASSATVSSARRSPERARSGTTADQIAFALSDRCSGADRSQLLMFFIEDRKLAAVNGRLGHVPASKVLLKARVSTTAPRAQPVR